MLPGAHYDGLELVRTGLERADDRGHLDRFGAGAHDDGNTQGLWAKQVTRVVRNGFTANNGVEVLPDREAAMVAIRR
ncbi:MAG: hypothetical protein RhofKO_32450 [Rhodothermales bacterium]